jgi:ATP synthase F1 complex assembly factor 2
MLLPAIESKPTVPHKLSTMMATSPSMTTHAMRLVRQCLRTHNTRNNTVHRALSSSARDTRVAGRRRFYLEVNIQQVPAPWSSQNANTEATVDSGISAGVDGTQSASGVSNRLETSTRVLQNALLPKQPSTLIGANKDDIIAPSSSATNITWHTVTLDGRALRTPMGRTLAVPSKLLATALAAEWNAVTHKLNPTQMPLMTLVCTVLDQVSQPNVQQSVKDDCMNYLSTDTICYFADPLQDRVLFRKQEEHWKPVHGFISRQFNTETANLYGAQEAMLSAKHRQLPHSPKLAKECMLLLQQLDAWHLQILYSVCRETKSLLLGLAVLLDHYQDDSMQAAVEAARVEEEFQISCWGMVEGGHDYDRLNCAVQIQAAVILKDCLAMDCFSAE